MEMEVYQALPPKQTLSARVRADEAYNLFIVEVKRVDFETKTLTVEDTRSKLPYETKLFPVNASSATSTDGVMPEEGSLGLAAFLERKSTYGELAVVAWMISDTTRAIDAIAVKPMASDKEIPDWTNRKRGIYRKMYPAQKVASLTAGFTEKEDEGWDKTTSDFSRDKLDALRRTRFLTTGRSVTYDDSGLSLSGPVNRPNASKDDITPTILPDGTKEWTLYLAKKGEKRDRYFNGASNMLPVVERTEKIQEFALDYPLPLEILESDMLHPLLGLWENGVTTTKTKDKISYDDHSFLISQESDHPNHNGPTIGPSKGEGTTPIRKGWIIESSRGTLVGSNSFDATSYGKILKPKIFPYTKGGRHGSNTESGYLPINKKDDQVEARVAASAWSLRFPYEYNTTRFDISKEGHLQFELGSTIPKENITWDGSSYEHPYGAGRSVDGHLTGSLRLAVGKNRDEEESIDITTMGGAVLRLGSDDATLPTSGRTVQTQIRSNKDAIGDRKIQYWSNPKLKKQGDDGTFGVAVGAKTVGECVSLRAAFDGGTFLRLGARHADARRKHLKNGFVDAKGRTPGGPDSKSPERLTYGAKDSDYRFHDLSTTGKPLLGKNAAGIPPYAWSGDPVGDMDKTGLSADIHAVRDILLRVGKNPQNGQSLLLDTDGGIVAAVGKDKLSRSIVAALDGSIEATIGGDGHRAVRLEINGDVDVSIKGNLHLNVTGDIFVEGVRINSLAKLLMTNKTLTMANMAMVGIVNETMAIANNENKIYEATEDGKLT